MALYDVCQMDGEQGVRTQCLTVLSECRGVVAGIEDEVRLLERQFVGISRRPLFENLVANAPHEDTGVVAVAQHQICEVALVPLLEETGIVVLCLLASPHVERLVHHDESHSVAHVQQFRSGRIMRTADAVHAHGLQSGEFAVQGVFVEGRSQTAEVVVLADTVDLEVLAIEPKTCLRVETERAETCGGLVGIDEFATLPHLCKHRIDVGLLTGPKKRVINGHTRFQSFRTTNNLAIGGYQGVLDGNFLPSCRRSADKRSGLNSLQFHLNTYAPFSRLQTTPGPS